MENTEERKKAESVLYWMMQNENKALNSTDFFFLIFPLPSLSAYITWFSLKCLRAITESWVSHKNQDHKKCSHSLNSLRIWLSRSSFFGIKQSEHAHILHIMGQETLIFCSSAATLHGVNWRLKLVFKILIIFLSPTVLLSSFWLRLH